MKKRIWLRSLYLNKKKIIRKNGFRKKIDKTIHRCKISSYFETNERATRRPKEKGQSCETRYMESYSGGIIGRGKNHWGDESKIIGYIFNFNLSSAKFFSIHLFRFRCSIFRTCLFVEKYQKLENEKKNTRTVRKKNVGPMIRYQSLSMPVVKMIEDITNKEDEKINVETVEDKSGDSVEKATTEEYEFRHFLLSFKLYFPVH